MFFEGIRIRNFRCFRDTGMLPLGPITLVVGRNNSGKSAMLRALYALQDGVPHKESDIRIREVEAGVDLVLSGNEIPLINGAGAPLGKSFSGGLLSYRLQRTGLQDLAVEATSGQKVAVNRPGAQDPNHLMHPIFSGRFNGQYVQGSDANSSRQIWPNDQNIVSRVKQIASADIAEARHFRRLCQEVLGITFEALDTANSGGSQQLGVSIDRHTKITWDAMGAGLASTLNLLVTLSVAENKVILIEEPENDLHPKALKVLLDAIVESSEKNQFLVSTHSATVLTRLGGISGSVVLYVSSDGERLPTSTIRTVDGPAERLGVLSDLGYEFADLSLGEGWLIFEESSAQRIVQQFLIPWFTPNLSRLRIVGASGDSRIMPLMIDFKEMFLFAHLEEAYQGRAWVVVDGGPAGEDIVSRLKSSFPGWPSGRFCQWSQTDFEFFYPGIFKTEVSIALGEKNKKKKKELKKDLLDKVIAWVVQDPDRAKAAFMGSAEEVIGKLRNIDSELLTMGFSPSPVPLKPV